MEHTTKTTETLGKVYYNFQRAALVHHRDEHKGLARIYNIKLFKTMICSRVCNIICDIPPVITKRHENHLPESSSANMSELMLFVSRVRVDGCVLVYAFL